ncbi:23S rRNA (uracil(1939)-C(5))-methyltransferase RlmD [Lentilactobacillus sp. SPB1-3]|uniref:23S rRNA (Uracil(1939)-C(5))-methyltransferase RlmD n=1 Tax=Lentilactobacillus terminaliae TaxID=3003483 RepID=A0ACD5DGS7_9LACO|nr:23S rRNA (uracil(1939)-C(5))-methyltransferase RlmD [Lentilactobacillus sp. SPB1-3]MCZ0976790.1 23S rRNA (uracil(1939)-C(5))-methyltransferase RlmD [Lentilactobacillus sp. SPB1-3]
MKFTAPVAKNETYEVTIQDLTYEGMGVAKIEDFPIFIENALVGEKVITLITKVKKNFAFGRVDKVLVESSDRVHGIEKAYTQTGITPLQHLKYPAQLKFKQHQVQVDFDKLKIPAEVNETIGMEDPFHYRNKAQIPVRNVNGLLSTGFYKKHSHEMIPLEDFKIQDERIDKAVLIVRDILRKFQLEAYDERNHTGVIRNIMVRVGKYSGEMMIVLVTRTKKLPSVEEITRQINEQIPGLTSLIQNINPEKTNVVLGKKNVLLSGVDRIHDQLMGLDFEISANSFYQVNPVQTEKLYQLAIDKAELTKDDVVIDAYSGIGTISLSVANSVKQVYGVEVVEDAVKDAETNAKINKIKNVKFVVNKAEEQMEKWQADGLKPDVVIVDPPRKGLAESLIKSVADMNPKRVVYVSCNPATLARDVKLFGDFGYHLNQPVQPVDQFPQTVHVESVSVLEKA